MPLLLKTPFLLPLLLLFSPLKPVLCVALTVSFSLRLSPFSLTYTTLPNSTALRLQLDFRFLLPFLYVYMIHFARFMHTEIVEEHAESVAEIRKMWDQLWGCSEQYREGKDEEQTAEAR